MKYVKKGNLRDIDFQKIFIYNNGEIAFVNNLKDLEKTNQAIPLEISVSYTHLVVNPFCISEVANVCSSNLYSDRWSGSI